MANAAKNKGDRFELEAVEWLKLAAPDLAVEGAQRMLGAGRAQDVGDLYFFEDVAVQVRAYKEAGTGLRSAAHDSVAQAANGRVPFGLGMYPVPKTPKNNLDEVRWLASTTIDMWPEKIGGLPEFSTPKTMIDWLRVKPTPKRPDVLPLRCRVALLVRAETDPVVVGTMQAWLASYRQATMNEGPGVTSGEIGWLCPPVAALVHDEDESKWTDPVGLFPDDGLGVSA